MRLHGLVVFALFLGGTARRNLRIDDGHREAQRQNNTLINAVEGSIATWETFIPWRSVGLPRANGTLHTANGPKENQLTAVRRSALPFARVDKAAAGEAAAVGDAAPPPSLEFFTLDMCPYAQRCWIVLEELGVNYSSRTVNLRGGGEERRWYEETVNPRGKVPALRDARAGLTIFESLIINEYLAESCEGGAALLPTDAVVRARIRLWNDHLDTQLAPAHFTLLMNKDGETEDAKSAALDAALAHYEAHLVGPYLCGDTFTLADAAALPFFERLVFSLAHYKQIDALASYPRTRAWLEVAMARESFVKTKRPEAKLIASYDRFLKADYAFGGLNRNS